MRTLVMLIRLLALAGTLAAAGVLGMLAVAQGAEPSRRAREAERAALAEQSAGAVRAILEGALAHAQAVAGRVQPWSGDPARVLSLSEELTRLASAAPVLDIGFFVTDHRGLVVATSSGQAALLGQVRDWPHVRRALDGETAISDVVQDPLTRDVLVGVAVPLRQEDGTVTGALAGGSSVPGGPMTRQLATLRAPQGASLVIVTSSGQIVDPHMAPPQPAGLPLAAPVRRGRLGPAFVEYQGEGKVDSVAGVAPARDGWVAVVSEPAATFHATTTAGVRAGTNTIIVLMLCCLGALFVMDRSRKGAERRADAAKRAVLSIVGHELRTPLTIIKGFTSTLLQRWDDLDSQTRREFVETVERQSRNLEHLVERLLAGARLEAGIQSEPASEPVDIAPLLDRAVAHHSRMSPLHTVELDTPRPLPALGDGRALEQVLTHLLENAIKYSPSGGRIRVLGRRRRRHVTVVVEDEGVGLPSDTESIFDRFVQGEAVDTRTHDEGGMGLGLFIVREYIRHMGGTVTAERRDPCGARFIVTLRATERLELVRSG